MVDRVIRVALVGDATSLINAANTARTSLSGLANVNLGGVQSGMQGAGNAAQTAATQTTGWSTALKTGLAVVGVQSGFALIVSGFRQVMQTGLDYERNMNTLKAVTGANAKEMEALGKKATDLGNDLTLPGISAGDAARGMAELAKGGFSVQQAMDAAQGTMRLATAAQIDGAAAAEIQVNALNAFRLSADQAGHVADVLANAANSASGTIGDMAAGMKQTATVAAAYGISLDDTATTMALMAKNGVLGSDAGTSLKTALTQLATPTKQQKAAMDNLNLSVFDGRGNFVGMKDITEQLALAHQRMTTAAYSSAAGVVFGTDAIRVANILGAEGVAGWDKMAESVTRAGGAEELAAAQTLGTVGALNQLGSVAETAATNLFEKLSPAMTAVLDAASFLMTGVGALVDLFGKLPAPVEALIAAFALTIPVKYVLANIAGALWQVGYAAMGAAGETGLAMGLIRASMGLVSTAAKGMWAAIGGWGGLIFMAAITAVTAAISFFTGSTEEAKATVVDFSDAVDTATGKLKDNAAVTVADKVAENAQRYREAGGAMGDYTMAIMGNADAQERVHTVLQAQTMSIAESTGAWASYNNSNSQATLTLDEFATQLLAGKLHTEAYDVKLQGLKVTSDQFASDQGGLSGAVEKTSQKLLESNAATRAMAQAQKDAQSDVYGLKDAFLGSNVVAGDLDKTLEAVIKTAQAMADSDEASNMLRHFKNDADAAKASGDLFAMMLDGLDQRNASYDDTIAANSKSLTSLKDAWEKGTKAATDNAEAGNLNTEALANWDVAALNATPDGAALYTQLDAVAKSYQDGVAGAYANSIATDQATNAAIANGTATGTQITQQDMNARAMAATRDTATSQREAFIALAEQQNGGNTEAAVALADKLGIVDGIKISEKDFQIICDNADADAKVNAANDAKIAAKRFSITCDAGDAINTVNTLRAMLTALNSDVHVTQVGNQVIQQADQQMQDAYNQAKSLGRFSGDYKQWVAQFEKQHAEGGWVSGPGGPKSDSVSARLSAGEFVVNASQAGKHGALLEAINNGAMGFADGGAVPAGDAATSTDSTATATVSTPDPAAFKAVWDAIAAAVADAWTTIIAPTLQALTDASVAEGVTQQSLLADYVNPSWSAIGATVQNTVGAVVVPTFDAMNLATMNVGGTVQNAVYAVIVPTFDALNLATNQVGATAIALRDTAVNPAWQGMSDQVGAVWNWFGGGIFPAYTAGMYGLGAGAQNLAATTTASWQQIGASVSGTYNGQIVPAWTGVQNFANATGSFFAGIASGTASARASTTSDIAEITTAIDNFFNDVNGKAGTTTTTTTTTTAGGLAALADGGIISQGTGPRADDVTIRASRGEYVVNAAATSRHRDTLDAINYGGYADGGAIGDSIGTKVKDSIVSITQRAIEAGVTQALASFASSAGGFASNGNWGPVNMTGFAENAAAAKAYIEAHFGGVSSIGGLYGGSVSGSDHPFGKALDVMIANYKSPEGIAAGDAIAEWFYQNANAFGTKYEIWRDRIRDPGGPWEPYQHPSGSDDTLQHRDHVHLSFLTGTGGFGGQATVPADDVPKDGSWLSNILAKIKSTPTFHPTVGSTGGGGVEQWRAMALQALAATGQDPSWITAMLAQMNTESSGDPNAIQTSDINWQHGDPSIGLLQVIGTTFRDELTKHGHPELIPAGQADPWANMIAAIYHTVDNYGSLAKWNAAIGGNANPYDTGGYLPTGYSAAYNGTGSPEAVMTDRQWSIASSAMNHIIGSGAVTNTGQQGGVHVEQIVAAAPGNVLAELDFAMARMSR